MLPLDTHVLSEPLRPASDPCVLAWIDAQAIETLYLPPITVAELRFGIAAMPPDKRCDPLRRLEAEVLPLFQDRVLAFDLEAAQAMPVSWRGAREAGRGVAMADGCVAATAASRGLMVATRDTSPFEAAGLRTLDPWAPP
ncbi:PIN domain-containing protein [Methylobacterium frigidaeris]|uniref:Ribonuclease VapC n=1 Tax=Methylobacterium frigidaeris TaxID=2038277 RepID=A0AA37HDR8_9HYPH|nr:PIN domain-containing protein [Methylobacterium frigidaeris]PIK69753.1 VapC toxin family PIN domain ribonuclease [Methylobacterium frigidaeris]GJD63375.1 Toxin FitB [Methylobacterium frigidaeris]